MDQSGLSNARKTLPAFPEEARQNYPRKPLTAANAAAIPCRQVLGAYIVRFERQTKTAEITEDISLRNPTEGTI